MTHHTDAEKPVSNSLRLHHIIIMEKFTSAEVFMRVKPMPDQYLLLVDARQIDQSHKRWTNESHKFDLVFLKTSSQVVYGIVQVKSPINTRYRGR